MSQMIVRVSFVAGTDLDVAIEDAIEKVKALGIAYIEFTFNGIDISVHRYSDVKDVVLDYNTEILMRKEGVWEP